MTKVYNGNEKRLLAKAIQKICRVEPATATGYALWVMRSKKEGLNSYEDVYRKYEYDPRSRSKMRRALRIREELYE